MHFTGHRSLGRIHNLNSLEALSWNSFFRSVGEGFIGVYVPIYLFLIGQQFGGVRGGLVSIAMFTLAQRLVIAFFSIPMAHVVKKFGFRLSIFAGTTLEALFFLLLIATRHWHILLWLTAAAGGFSIMFYWLSRLSLISTDSKADRVGKAMGTLGILEGGSGVFGPFVGAVIATTFGFDVLFVVGMLLLLFSSLPMFYMPPHHHRQQVSFAGFWQWCKSGVNRLMIIGHVGRGLDDYVAGWGWTIFVFIFVGNLELFGALTSAVLLASMLAVFVASSLFDRKRLGFARVGSVSIVDAVLRVARGFAAGVPQLFVLDSITRIIDPFYRIGADGVMYLAAKTSNPLGFFAYREVIYSLANVAAAMVLLSLAGNQYLWVTLWLVGALGVLLGTFLAAQHKKVIPS